jgi:SeqA-like protein
MKASAETGRSCGQRSGRVLQTHEAGSRTRPARPMRRRRVAARSASRELLSLAGRALRQVQIGSCRVAMKRIEIDDELYAFLERKAKLEETPGDVIRRLIGASKTTTGAKRSSTQPKPTSRSSAGLERSR